MADLMKFVKDEFVTKKDFPFGAGDTITVYYEIKEGEKLEHSFSKVVIKEEVLVTQKLLLFVKCQVL
jgi:large subunit ribosomal protein L19